MPSDVISGWSHLESGMGRSYACSSLPLLVVSGLRSGQLGSDLDYFWGWKVENWRVYIIPEMSWIQLKWKKHERQSKGKKWHHAELLKATPSPKQTISMSCPLSVICASSPFIVSVKNNMYESLLKEHYPNVRHCCCYKLECGPSLWIDFLRIIYTVLGY